ncbi:hypothetical protein ACNQGB_05400 [Flavobacterium sp. XS1P32]|uniref:hypothetical protein n=1 Tax=Flavobacterium sp. XS1P32 TaxID=3401726 RepID=UPI003AABEA67
MKNLKIKKMTLTNIEGKLSKEEMENIMAGKGFVDGMCIAVGAAGTLGWLGVAAFATGGGAFVIGAVGAACLLREVQNNW